MTRSLRPVALALLAAALLSTAALAQTRDVLVLDTAKGGATLVLAAAATTSAQYAALELQYHLEKISGVKPVIAREPQIPAGGVKIALGNTALGKSLGFPVDKLAPWEFLIGQKQGVIVLAGGDAAVTEEAKWESLNRIFDGSPNGTCRAVFDFLERYCGVHWYLPSEAGMVYPSTRRLVAKMGPTVRRVTDFRSTSFYPYMVNKRMYSPVQWVDTEGGRPKLENPVKPADMLPVVEVQRWLVRNKVGGENYNPNHSFGHWLSRFGKDHPDWFSYQTKAKMDEILAKYPTPAEQHNGFHVTGNPCLSNPGTFAQTMTDARDYMDTRDRDSGRKPAAQYLGSGGRFFGIVLNDNYVMCQCDACRAQYNRPAVDTPMWGGADGSASFYLWDFVNRAARELRKTHPDAWIGGIAYHNYMPPPQDFTLEPNVGVTVCTYLGNWTPRLRETAYSLLRAWREQAKCQWLGTWEYQCYSALGSGGPEVARVCPRLLGQDIKKLHQLGVVAEFMEEEDHYGLTPNDQLAVWSNPIWLYLNTWIRFKIEDDVKRDPDQWLNEHYRLFYGPAEKPIRAFYDLLEKRISDQSLRGPSTFTNERSQNPAVDWEHLFPPPVMAQLRQSIDEATRLASAEPFRTRVEWVRAGFMEHMERMQARYLAGQKALGKASLPQTVCYPLAAAPVIDGQGDEPAWAALPLCGLGESRTGVEPKAAPTTFRVGHDGSNLYLLARCQEPSMKTVLAAQQDRDSDVWMDDCVEWHLTPDPERNFAWQIVVNSRGVIEDLRWQRNEGAEMVGGKGPNLPGLVAAATRDDQGYTVEIKVPLADLGTPVLKPGQVLAMNLCRERYAAGPEGALPELQSWSPAPDGFGNPSTFGQALLTSGDGHHVFFTPEAKLPEPFVYLVTKGKAQWDVVKEAITARAERDHVHYTMQQAAQEGLAGIKGTLSWALPQPVTVADYPLVEIRYRKSSPAIMLQMVYNYEAADGKSYQNWFIFSPMDSTDPMARTAVHRLGEGGETDRPAPVKLKHLTIHAVVYADRTPPECSFDLYQVRVANQTFAPPK